MSHVLSLNSVHRVLVFLASELPLDVHKTISLIPSDSFLTTAPVQGGQHNLHSDPRVRDRTIAPSARYLGTVVDHRRLGPSARFLCRGTSTTCTWTRRKRSTMTQFGRTGVVVSSSLTDPRGWDRTFAPPDLRIPAQNPKKHGKKFFYRTRKPIKKRTSLFLSCFYVRTHHWIIRNHPRNLGTPQKWSLSVFARCRQLQILALSRQALVAKAHITCSEVVSVARRRVSCSSAADGLGHLLLCLLMRSWFHFRVEFHNPDLLVRPYEKLSCTLNRT